MSHLTGARYALLHKAYARFVKNMPEDFSSFCEAEKDWLEDYTLFMALKDANDGKAWGQWDEKLRVRDAAALDEARKKYAEDIEFYKMLQYLFFKQWRELKAYANENGIEIIGDVPIYVAGDSADVWANPKQFYLDEDLNPIEVAGCPPDGFSADGQLWGNPLFRWDEMKKDNYAWWTKRIKAMSELYDIIRIDHFRGFDSYYAIPAKDKTAKNGKWKQGPGMDLFNQLEKKLGKLPIIVEDLGFLTDSVKQLLKDSGYPGMKVLQFAFDSREDSDYLPHNYHPNCVVYTGTHDNDTLQGWYQALKEEDKEMALEYIGNRFTPKADIHWDYIRLAMRSVADTCIIPVQDYLGLGCEARINTPSTLGGNWIWRSDEDSFTDNLAAKIKKITQLCARSLQQKGE